GGCDGGQRRSTESKGGVAGQGQRLQRAVPQSACAASPSYTHPSKRQETYSQRSVSWLVSVTRCNLTRPYFKELQSMRLGLMIGYSGRNMGSSIAQMKDTEKLGMDDNNGLPIAKVQEAERL